MIELLGDITWPLLPATATWLVFHDPLISGLWCAVGIAARWHRRRARHPTTAAIRIPTVGRDEADRRQGQQPNLRS
jgi:hypothetical protein